MTGTNGWDRPTPPDSRDLCDTGPDDRRAGDGGPADDWLGDTALEERLAALAGPAPSGYAARILRSVGIPAACYDTYVQADAPVGGLYVAYDHHKAITGTALVSTAGTPEAFEDAYLSRTGRSALPVTTRPPGLTTALRTGLTRGISFALPTLTEAEEAVLRTVRAIPPGQLRPASWVAAMSGGHQSSATVAELLAANPAPVLVPCHRVELPGRCPAASAPGPYPQHTGRALRRAEGIDLDRLTRFAEHGIVYLGSDTTRIYCHPTCSHARRITPPHQVPFRSTHDAVDSGYRACKSCQPIAA
jgi:O6-methylguanine-DNA--protein-cysteine methyltransferase